MLLLRVLVTTLIVAAGLTECAVLSEKKGGNDVSAQEQATGPGRTEGDRVKRNHRDQASNVCQAKKQVIAPIVAQNLKGVLIYLEKL